MEHCRVCVCVSLSTKTIVNLGTGCFYTILTLTFAKKRGGKGLLCLNTSCVPATTIFKNPICVSCYCKFSKLYPNFMTVTYSFMLNTKGGTACVPHSITICDALIVLHARHRCRVVGNILIIPPQSCMSISNLPD